MTTAVAEIVARLPDLSADERAELARAVLLSLEPEEAGVEEAWREELAGRVQRIRNGEAVGIPAEDVFAQWRRGQS